MQNRPTLIVCLWLGTQLCLAAAPGTAAALVEEMVIDPADLVVRSRGEHQVIDLEGGFHGLPPGAPDLPLVSLLSRLPAGTRAVEVRVHPVDTVTLPGIQNLAVVPGKISTSGAYVPDASGWFPEQPVIQFHSGRMRGQPMVAVSLSPVAWSQSSGELRLMTRFQVEVVTEPAPPDPGDLVIRRESAEGQRTVTTAISRLTGTVPPPSRSPNRYGPTSTTTAFAPTFRPSVDGSPVEMVIITSPDQEAEYQRLADFKTRIGVSCVVRTVDWILENYPQGVDTQETIRNFLKEAASQWGTVWVLLGGDTDQIPVRFGFTKHRGNQTIPTDLYYTDLDGNWNGNGDALFGEGRTVTTPGDSVDLFPDLWVGRLPSNDAAEAQNMVDKTLLYSQNPPLGYQNDFLFLGEVLFPGDWEEGSGWSLDGGNFCEQVVDSLLPHQQAVRLYENHTVYPGSLPETKATVIDSVNAGFGLVHHVGHGFINTMSVGIAHQSLGNVDAETFVNGDELFVLYSINCTSCAIDFNCIGEGFLTNTAGGAVAVIGSTDLEDPLIGAQLQEEFYSLLLGQGIQEIGIDLALCKIPLIASSVEDNPGRWSLFAQICLGDPNLQFWTDVPESLSVIHPTSLDLGSNLFGVTVSRSGSPVDSARVALFKENDAYAVAYTNAFGQATIPISPDFAGSLSVGVVAPNSIPYLGSSLVSVPVAPYLATGVPAVVDDGSGATNGNGDGRVDAGETVELHFTLDNNGFVLESGISAVLSSADPHVTINDSTSAYADIDSGNSMAPSDPIVVTISPDAPDLLEAPATLTITGSLDTYVQSVILYVHAPTLEYWLQTVRDTVGSGNGDGNIGADEDFAIIPYFRNIGQGDLRNAEVRLRSLDPAVSIGDSVGVLGDIASGAVAVNSADGLAARFLDASLDHELVAVVVDAYGEVFSRSLDLTPPDTIDNLSGSGTSSSIALSWNPVSESDLWGYAVFRAPSSSGPYVRVNEWTTYRTSYYEDNGLPGFARFHYRVAAIDSSGNQGTLSTPASASTTLPLHEGWPVDVVTATPSGVAVADVDGDGSLEILGGGDAIYVMTQDGQDFHDGDIDARTLGPLFDSGGVRFWNAPAVGDVDGDGASEVATIGWEDDLLHLVDRFGQPVPGWPRDINPQGLFSPNPIGSVCLSDVDSDGDLEVICTAGRVILAWHHTGIELTDGDADPLTDGVLAITGSPYSYGTPSVANIDAEPHREIIAGMRDGSLYVFNHDGTPYPGFPFATGGFITSSPAVGDIDGNGLVEIVFGSGDGNVYAIRSDLSSAPGFPRPIALAEDWDPSPALGDITGDGYPDVVIGGSDGLLHAWSGMNGSVVPGFPVAIQDNLGAPVSTRSSPVLADVDGDGSVDVLMGDRSGQLHGYDATGQPLPGFPIVTGNRIEHSPAVWDGDEDGLVEVIAQSEDKRIYCWDTPWTFDPALAPWPMFKGNSQNSGNLGDAPIPGTRVGIVPGELQTFLLQNFPNPFSRSTSIRYRVPEDRSPVAVQLRIYDMAGRVVATLVDGVKPPGLHEVPWDGKDRTGRRVASGIYPYRLRVGGQTTARKMILIQR
jgi:hypothetical protein